MLPPRISTRRREVLPWDGIPGDNLEGPNRDNVTQGSGRPKEREVGYTQEGEMQRRCPRQGDGFCVDLKQEWLQPYREDPMSKSSLSNPIIHSFIHSINVD